MTSTELRAIERYAEARIQDMAAQSDLNGYHPDGPSAYDRAFAAATARVVEESYKELPLAYQFLLAELAAEETEQLENFFAATVPA